MSSDKLNENYKNTRISLIGRFFPLTGEALSLNVEFSPRTVKKCEINLFIYNQTYAIIYQ